MQHYGACLPIYLHACNIQYVHVCSKQLGTADPDSGSQAQQPKDGLVLRCSTATMPAPRGVTLGHGQAILGYMELQGDVQPFLSQTNQVVWAGVG